MHNNHKHLGMKTMLRTRLRLHNTNDSYNIQKTQVLEDTQNTHNIQNSYIGGIKFRKKIVYVSKKNHWAFKFVKNLDNECDVKLHFRTSYCCNLQCSNL